MFQMTLGSLIKDKNSYQEALELKREIDKYIVKGQYIIANEKCEELITIIKQLPDDKKNYKKFLLQNVVNLNYSMRGRYLKTSEIWLGTYVNATVEFKPSFKDPGFWVYDERGECHDCYIKKIPDLKVGDEARLWITGTKKYGRIIYLEPRVEKEDILFVKPTAFTKKGDYLFRFLSYDGFIKNEGATRYLNIKVGANYKSKVEYSRLATKINMHGKIFRIGVLFAHALEEVTEEEYEKKKGRVYSLEGLGR